MRKQAIGETRGKQRAHGRDFLVDNAHARQLDKVTPDRRKYGETQKPQLKKIRPRGLQRHRTRRRTAKSPAGENKGKTESSEMGPGRKAFCSKFYFERVVGRLKDGVRL